MCNGTGWLGFPLGTVVVLGVGVLGLGVAAGGAAGNVILGPATLPRDDPVSILSFLEGPCDAVPAGGSLRTATLAVSGGTGVGTGVEVVDIELGSSNGFNLAEKILRKFFMADFPMETR